MTKMKSSTNGFVQAAFMFVALIALMGSVSAQNVLCRTSNKRFATGAECNKDCKGGGLGIIGNPCVYSPLTACKALASKGADGDEYWNKVFESTLMGGPLPAAKLQLPIYTINRFFQPNKHTDFNISWGRTGTSDYAHVTPASSSEQKMNLVISEDALGLPPGGFMMAIGHEMIHAEQLKRHRNSKVDRSGIDRVLSPLRELEASAWELGEGSFRWVIGPNKWKECLRENEKQESAFRHICNAWDVKKGIQDIRDRPRSDQYLRNLEKFMTEDAWISQVWLKANPNWKTETLSNQPIVCKQ
jgi:hypothetical protein